jgi:hypothetical protein
MKHNLKKKTLTFGGLIESVYGACAQPRAKALVRLALKAHVITFREPHHFIIS